MKSHKWQGKIFQEFVLRKSSNQFTSICLYSLSKFLGLHKIDNTTINSDKYRRNLTLYRKA